MNFLVLVLFDENQLHITRCSKQYCMSVIANSHADVNGFHSNYHWCCGGKAVYGLNNNIKAFWNSLRFIIMTSYFNSIL